VDKPKMNMRQLEAHVLGGSGLGATPAWGNGPGASHIRHLAAYRLEQAIGYQHGAGEEIAKPEPDMFRYVDAAADLLDLEEWDLSRTWQVAADVARAHIYLFHAKTEAEGAKTRASFVKTMREYYRLVPAELHTYGLEGDASFLEYAYARGHRYGGRHVSHGLCLADGPLGGGVFPDSMTAIGLHVQAEVKKLEQAQQRAVRFAAKKPRYTGHRLRR
jgi:hypothetical protein